MTPSTLSVLFIGLLLISTLLGLLAAFGAMLHTDQAWEGAEQERLACVVALLGSTFLGFGWLAAVVYVFALRPQLRAAMGATGLGASRRALVLAFVGFGIVYALWILVATKVVR